MDGLKPLNLPSLKSLPPTRWSERHDATFTLKKGYKVIRQVLNQTIEDESEKSETNKKARNLIITMEELETGSMVELWAVILERFNKTSKTLQDPQLDLNVATGLLVSLMKFIQTLRPQFGDFENKGRILTNSDNYKTEVKRKRKRNTRRDDGDAEHVTLLPFEKFKVEGFLPILDKLLAELTKRVNVY